MKTLFTVALCAICLPIFAQTTIFQQNFNSSALISDYAGAPPSSSQFDFIGSTGSGMTFSIESGKLKFSKTGSNSGNFTRNTDFTNVPQAIDFSFKIAVSDNIAAEVSAAIMYIGDGYSTNFGIPTNLSTYARLAFSFSNAANTLVVRDISNGNNSSSFMGEVAIHWVLNNSGSVLNYTAPSGTAATLANDRADVWVENTLTFNDIPIEATTQNMANIKFLFNDGNASIILDDIQIIDLLAVLPIELASFTSKPSVNAIILNWKTLAETQCDHFNIEHSETGTGFQEIGSVKSLGKMATETSYEFRHNSPSVGRNYYRLRQVNNHDHFEYSKVVVIPFGDKSILISPNPAYDFLSVQTAMEQELPYRISNIAGQTVSVGHLQNEMQIDIRGFPKGMYFIQIQEQQTIKFIKK